MRSTVAEIHAYPVRPEGFAEPLFLTAGSRKEIAEHLAASGWLRKASRMEYGEGATAHRRAERVSLERAGDGRLVLARAKAGHHNKSGYKGRSVRRKPVRCVLCCWREVGSWWEASGGTDRHLYRLLLSDGSVVDVAREKRGNRRGGSRGGGWTLVGIVD